MFNLEILLGDIRRLIALVRRSQNPSLTEREAYPDSMETPRQQVAYAKRLYGNESLWDKLPGDLTVPPSDRSWFRTRLAEGGSTVRPLLTIDFGADAGEQRQIIDRVVREGTLEKSVARQVLGLLIEQAPEPIPSAFA